MGKSLNEVPCILLNYNIFIKFTSFCNDFTMIRIDFSGFNGMRTLCEKGCVSFKTFIIYFFNEPVGNFRIL